MITKLTKKLKHIEKMFEIVLIKTQDWLEKQLRTFKINLVSNLGICMNGKIYTNKF